MSRTLDVRLSATTLLMLVSWAAYTQDPKQPPELAINKVKDHLF